MDIRANTNLIADIGRQDDMNRILNIKEKTDHPPAYRQYKKTNAPNHRASQASRTTDGKPICNKCKKAGHFARFCPQQKNNTDAVPVQALHASDSPKRRIDIIINKKPAQGLIDTGADISVVSEKFAKKFPEDMDAHGTGLA